MADTPTPRDLTRKMNKSGITPSRILVFIANNPGTTAAQVAETLGIPQGTVGPTILSLRREGNLKVTGTLQQIDPDTDRPVRGRRTQTLDATYKGRKIAERILEMAFQLAQDHVEAENAAKRSKKKPRKTANAA